MIDVIVLMMHGAYCSNSYDNGSFVVSVVVIVVAIMYTVMVEFILFSNDTNRNYIRKVHACKARALIRTVILLYRNNLITLRTTENCRYTQLPGY